MTSRPLHRFSDLAQRRSNAGNELLTGLGQRDTSGRSVKQAHAEFRLQRRDGMAQRRARHAELGRSRAEAAVEAKLGVRLFHRTTRSVSLTEAGEQFVSSVAPALGQIKEAMERAGSHRATPAGTLRINTSAGAARQMESIVFEYLRRYPDMTVDIVTEGRLVDIVVDGFGAGVRP